MPSSARKKNWSESFWKNLVTYAPLPILLAVAVGLAPQLRLYRSFFLDEINQDYVRTARANGVPEKTVLMKHVLRNAMIPILTSSGISLPGVFVGSFLLEVFFSIPGLGREIITAVNRSDFFFFNDTTASEIYTLSLHDALPI